MNRPDLLALLLREKQHHWHADHGDRSGADVWDYVTYYRSAAALETMLDAGLTPPPEKTGLLLAAAHGGSLHTFQRLSALGFKIDTTFSMTSETIKPSGKSVGPRKVLTTPLIVAARQGHHALLEPMAATLKLDLDADLGGDRQRDILLRVLLERGDLEPAINWVVSGAKVDGASHAISPSTLLSQVVEGGDMLRVEFLLRLGADPTAAGLDGVSALTAAKSLEMKRLLQGASVAR